MGERILCKNLNGKEEILQLSQTILAHQNLLQHDFFALTELAFL